MTTHSWVEAAKLHTGDRLVTADGATATAVGGSTPENPQGWMRDLTIDTDHGFYVMVGATPVLVHNDPSGGDLDGPMFDTSTQARLDAMRQAGLPTSLTPRSATYYSGGYGNGGGCQYVYDYNGQTWLVTDNWNDLNADAPHPPRWEVGVAKPGGQTDALGRLRVSSDKAKAYYGGGCG